MDAVKRETGKHAILGGPNIEKRPYDLPKDVLRGTLTDWFRSAGELRHDDQEALQGFFSRSGGLESLRVGFDFN